MFKDSRKPVERLWSCFALGLRILNSLWTEILWSFEVGLDAFYILIWLQTYWAQRTEYGGLTENGPHGLIISIVNWHLVELFGKEGLDGVVLLERCVTEVKLWGFKSPCQTQSMSLPAVCGSRCKAIQTITHSEFGFFCGFPIFIRL